MHLHVHVRGDNTATHSHRHGPSLHARFSPPRSACAEWQHALRAPAPTRRAHMPPATSTHTRTRTHAIQHETRRHEMTLSHGPWMTQVVRCVVAVAVTVARESKLLRSCARQLKARQGVRSFVRSFTSVCVCVWVWGVEYGVMNSSRPGARGGNESTTDNHQQQAASQRMPAWQCREMGWGGREIHSLHSRSHSLTLTLTLTLNHALTHALTHSLTQIWTEIWRFGGLEVWRFGGLEFLWRVWILDFGILRFWDFGILGF